ncbi:MAG: hypothetical protein FJX30_05575 [Alphaproteobacteria bacterium]|nr:hypothetical protein [Alphaproteobacteria bacterium]
MEKKIKHLDAIIKALGKEGQKSTLSSVSSERDQYNRDLYQPIKFENLKEHLDEKTKLSTGFEYSELEQLISQYRDSNFDGKACFEKLDSSRYTFNEFEEIEGTELSVYSPSLYQKFMGYVLNKKYREEWKKDLKDRVIDIAGEASDSIISDGIKQNSFVSVNVIDYIADQLGFELQHQDNFQRRIKEKNSTDDDKMIWIHNPRGVHFTAFVPSSEIARFENEVTQNQLELPEDQSGPKMTAPKTPLGNIEDKLISVGLTPELFKNSPKLKEIKESKKPKIYQIGNETNDFITFYFDQKKHNLKIKFTTKYKELDMSSISHLFIFDENFELKETRQDTTDATGSKTSTITDFSDNGFIEILEERKSSLKKIINKIKNAEVPNNDPTAPELNRAKLNRGGARGPHR